MTFVQKICAFNVDEIDTRSSNIVTFIHFILNIWSKIWLTFAEIL